MRSSAADKDLSKVLEQLNIIQDYIQLKFGVDFTLFLNSRKNEEDVPPPEDVDVCVVCRSKYKGQTDGEQGKSTRPCPYKKSDVVVTAEKPKRRYLRSSTGAGSSAPNDNPERTQRSEQRFQNGDQVTTLSEEESESDPAILVKEEMFSDGYDEDFMDLPNSNFLDPEFLPFDEDSSSGNEDEESKTAENETSGILKKRRQRQQFDEVAEFSTLDEAKAHIVSLGEFRHHHATENKEDTTHYYRCKNNRRCPARMMIRVPKIGIGGHPLKMTVERARSKHTHDQTKSQKGIPEAVKTEILRIYCGGIKKPNNILKALEKLGLPPLAKVQLNNFLRSVRIEKGLIQKRLSGSGKNKGHKRSGRPRKIPESQGPNPSTVSCGSSSLLPELPPPIPTSTFDLKDGYI